MARGYSGRIAAEVDPDLRAGLYEVLARDRPTLEAWFIREVERHVQGHRQPARFAADPAGLRHGGAPKDPGEDS